MANWRSNGPPAIRCDQVALLDQSTDLLDRWIKRDRIPAVVRRDVDTLDGRTRLGVTLAGEFGMLRDELEETFRCVASCSVIESSLPEPHVWLRLTQPHHHDAFDMPYAREIGGRWNPPRSWLARYLIEDMATCTHKFDTCSPVAGSTPMTSTTRRPSSSLLQHCRSDNAWPTP